MALHALLVVPLVASVVAQARAEGRGPPERLHCSECPDSAYCLNQQPRPVVLGATLLLNWETAAAGVRRVSAALLNYGRHHDRHLRSDPHSLGPAVPGDAGSSSSLARARGYSGPSYWPPVTFEPYRADFRLAGGHQMMFSCSRHRELSVAEKIPWRALCLSHRRDDLFPNVDP
jgi:hypothetical protein